MSILSLPNPTSAVPKTNPYEVLTVGPGISTRLYNRDKASTLASQNGVAVLTQAGAAWVASRTIVIYFDGLVETALYVPTEPEFNDWKAKSVAIPYDSNVAPSVEFVQFAGADTMAGVW